MLAHGQADPGDWRLFDLAGLLLVRLVSLPAG
jgi:hypothetical protein